MQSPTIVLFPSQLGWMTLVVVGTTVRDLTFGHRARAAARAAVGQWEQLLSATVVSLGQTDLQRSARGKRRRRHSLDDRIETIVRRLQGYASGQRDEFHDLRIDPGPMGQFRCRVFERCRRVAYGSTISYAALAAEAGYAGAARAVGNCMAANRIPLIVPCHRVVCSDGRLGSYSGPGGTAMKRRLLAIESDELT